MICSRILAGVDQSILRSTRNPLLNHEPSKCTTSRSSAARSLWPSISVNRSARIATRSPVRPEIAHQRLEEGEPALGIEIVIVVEHLTRHRGARGFAPAGQQRLAQVDQAVGVLLVVRR